MRIISGTNRGTKLFTLEGANTRPTLDRVKEPLFSIITANIPDALVLDLFSGSGALGLECVSRGAKASFLCDNSKDAISIINKNIQKLRVEDKVKVYNTDYEQALNRFIGEKLKFDIIFLDPPYLTDYAEKACKIIIENNLLQDDGIIIIETDNKEKVIYNLRELSQRIYNQKSYGRVDLLFLR